MVHRIGLRTASLGLALVLSFAGRALAEPDFRMRATGHVYQCGSRVVEFAKGGPTTVTLRDQPAILTATRVKWRPARVKLGFGPAAPPLSLSTFGATVTLKSADGTVPCVTVR